MLNYLAAFREYNDDLEDELTAYPLSEHCPSVGQERVVFSKIKIVEDGNILVLYRPPFLVVNGIESVDQLSELAIVKCKLIKSLGRMDDQYYYLVEVSEVIDMLDIKNKYDVVEPPNPLVMNWASVGGQCVDVLIGDTLGLVESYNPEAIREEFILFEKISEQALLLIIHYRDGWDESGYSHVGPVQVDREEFMKLVGEPINPGNEGL